MISQTTNIIMIIRPVAFGYNAETAQNNYFQQNDTTSPSIIQEKALAEFQNFAELLISKGIDAQIFNDTIDPLTPDSIFPNNWISFHENKTLVLYPMYAKNRQLERRRDIIDSFRSYEIVDYSTYEKDNVFLEGTGSMILDRENKIAFAAISERTNKLLFEKFCTELSYQAICFQSYQTVGLQRLPIYHSNVMMSIADKYAIVCLDSIDDEKEKQLVIDTFQKSGKEIIDISNEQMHSFAGNMLQLKGAEDKKYLVMSQCAYDSLTTGQIVKLKSYNDFIVAAIPTIEKYGGGSVRCMIAEIF